MKKKNKQTKQWAPLARMAGLGWTGWVPKQCDHAILWQAIVCYAIPCYVVVGSAIKLVTVTVTKR